MFFGQVFNCHALIVAPGGVGTMDELFEILNLKQTGKISKDLPVVLFGKTFWTTIVNWETMIRYGELTQEEFDSMCFTDSEDEAFNFCRLCLEGRLSGVKVVLVFGSLSCALPRSSQALQSSSQNTINISYYFTICCL